MKLNKKTDYAYILIGVGTAWLLISLLIALYMFNYGEGYMYFGYGRGGWYYWCIIYDSFGEFFIEEFFNFEECFFYGFISMLGILILIVGIIVMFTTKPVIVSPQQKSVEDDNVENLIHLKTLLDNGVITQEDFEEKKKQLLNM